MDEDVETLGGPPEEPEYELPDAVGDDREAASPDEEDEQTQDPEEPAARGKQPGKESRRAPAGPPNIPDYRVQQQSRQIAEQRDTIEKLTKRLEGLATALGAPDKAATPDPKKEGLRKQFLELFPEFQALIELSPKGKDLLGLVDRAGQTDADNDKFWANVATRTQNRLYSHAAKEYGVKELSKFQRKVVKDALVSWVEEDETGERNYRYESQDPELITEFWKDFASVTAAPARRHADAETLRRGRQPLPRGGRSTGPVTGVQPEQKTNDPDAVHARAWRMLEDQQAAAR